MGPRHDAACGGWKQMEGEEQGVIEIISVPTL
jgi:hypothetical protein